MHKSHTYVWELYSWMEQDFGRTIDAMTSRDRLDSTSWKICGHPLQTFTISEDLINTCDWLDHCDWQQRKSVPCRPPPFHHPPRHHSQFFLSKLTQMSISLRKLVRRYFLSYQKSAFSRSLCLSRLWWWCSLHQNIIFFVMFFIFHCRHVDVERIPRKRFQCSNTLQTAMHPPGFYITDRDRE